MGFTKLDEGIVESSVWAEDSDTLRVWIYLLAKADSMGVVYVTIPAIALQNGLHLDRVQAILTKFTNPDPNSRSSENEGRRIRIDREPTFSITLLNYMDYRWKDHTHAERQKRYREAHRDVTRDARDASLQSRGTQDRRQKTEDISTKDSCPTPLDESEAAPRKKRKTIAYSEDFLAFWKMYPRPKAKGHAFKAWMGAIRKVEDIATIFDALRLQIPSLMANGDKYCPHPATWLNGCQWEDEGPRTDGDVMTTGPHAGTPILRGL